MEVDPGPATWYIDAWAVHDGRVFASRRLPSEEPGYLQSARSTVFMSVPDLQAVPVGRISTALRATRSGFQHGFRDTDGAEIAFESLAQVRDLVRRAYLAAELGPGSPGATAGPAPGPDVIAGGPGRRYLDEQDDEDRQPIFDNGWPPDKELDITGLERAIENLAIASIIEWAWRLNQLSEAAPETERAYIGWIAAVMRANVFCDRELSVNPRALFRRLIDVAHEPWMSRWTDQLFERTPPGLGPFDLAAGAYWTRGHLAIVPLPPSGRWDHRLRRIIEMHLLPMIRSDFWRHPVFPADIAPLVLVEMVQSKPSYLGRLAGDPPPVLKAFAAVRSVAHFIELPLAAAAALDGFIDACLNGDMEQFEPPAGRLAYV